MSAWDLLPKSEQISELYFTKPELIPTFYTPAQPLEISFTIRNNTDAAQNYHYTVTQYNEDHTTSSQLHKSSTVIQPNEQKSTTVMVVPVDLGQRASFDIALTDNSQIINFWATKK